MEIRDAVKRPLFGTVMVEGNDEIMKLLEEKDPSEIMEEAA